MLTQRLASNLFEHKYKRWEIQKQIQVQLQMQMQKNTQNMGNTKNIARIARMRMLSSVTIDCQVTEIVMDSGSQLSEL